MREKQLILKDSKKNKHFTCLRIMDRSVIRGRERGRAQV